MRVKDSWLARRVAEWLRAVANRLSPEPQQIQLPPMTQRPTGTQNSYWLMHGTTGPSYWGNWSNHHGT